MEENNPLHITQLWLPMPKPVFKPLCAVAAWAPSGVLTGKYQTGVKTSNRPQKPGRATLQAILNISQTLSQSVFILLCAVAYWALFGVLIGK